MKIELLDIEKLITLNEPYGAIGEVTSPRLFSVANKMYDSEGILSNEIFGISKGDRRSTFGYINLGQPFLHPHIYGHVIKRMFRNIIYIVSGQKRFSVREDGKLVQDDNGWTGLDALYKNWNKIDWDKSNSSNERSLKFLRNIGRNEAFITKMLVCPPAYRDVMLAGTVDSSDHVNELNDLYTRLIRNVALLSEGGIFAKEQFTTQNKVQDILGAIYDYFKGQISEKSGLIRKYLMGKTVDFGTRSVISAFAYNNETIQDNMVDLDHTALPIAQCCSTFYPFIETWLKNFFTREIINDPNLVTYFDTKKNKEVNAVLKDPEVQFSEKAIKKMINDFVFNPNNRFKEIRVDAVIVGAEKNTEIKSAVMLLKGKYIAKNNVHKSLNRAMTITDILYLACVDVCEKRHVMITRYPVGTDKGIIINKVRVQSTINKIKLILNEKEYPYYPDVDFNIPTDKVGVQFIDTTVFSNSYLKGMGGDFDGDQVSVRGIWTDEANREAEEIMNRKMTALNITGTNSRVVGNEILNSYYALSKEGKDPKKITDMDSTEYLTTSPDGFTRSKIVHMFADTTNIAEKKNANRRKARHQTWDRITIPKDYFYPGHAETVTTIGRFLFNKYVLQGAGIIPATEMFLNVINKGTLEDLDNEIGYLYMDDKISRAQFNLYIDRRDNLGYWLNGMLVNTISPRMVKPLKEIETYKKQLYKQYEKEIAEGNIEVMAMIEKLLIERAKELLEDDPGMDLYNSGDLDFGNCYKNNAILKGPVYNKLTKSYDFIGNSFMNGIEIEDIPAHANSILSGQYPASIATQDSGYMGKKLLALLQMMEIDEPGTDCKTKALIPITVTNANKRDLIYSYFQVGDQLQLLTRDNIASHVGKTLMMRSPMSCTTKKLCSRCAGELFYKLDVKDAGLFATQLSHTMLNLALKAKHVQTVQLYQIDPNNIIQDV